MARLESGGLREKGAFMEAGDHIKVSRRVYSHHGIYVGDDEVIHYTLRHGGKRGASIRRDRLADFGRRDRVEVVRYAHPFPPYEVVRRAESRLGENGYDLFGNNCEHFARWCCTGEQSSEQVRHLAATAAGGVGGASLAAFGLDAVATGGAVAGISGAGIMSGLKSVGAPLGAGAVGGIALLSVAPAVATSLAMAVALKDDAALPNEERDARRAGRIATVVGASAGVAGTVGLVATAGSVSGLSAAGISSGVAAVGKAFGGGMKLGTAIVLAAPGLVAVLAGWLVYRFMKSRAKVRLRTCGPSNTAT